MLLKKSLKNLDQIIYEHISINTITLILIFLFSDLSSFNNYLKINLLQFFFLSNFWVEFSFFDTYSFLKSNIFSLNIFFPLIFQIYIIYLIYENSNKKIIYIFNIIFILSFFYFIFNLFRINLNFLPFDKLWIIFLFKSYLTNTLLIKYNRITLVIFILSIINYYISINISIYIIFLVLLIFTPTKKIIKFKTPIKLILPIYIMVLTFLYFANSLTILIHKSDKNFNLHYILSKNFFLKNHFTKMNLDQNKLNKIYKEKCLNGENKCLSNGKKPIFIIGDTQMQQYLASINNLENFFLAYSNVKKQCLFSSQLKHINFLKYYLKFEEPKDCSEKFKEIIRVLEESKNLNKSKIILISSWYNWYFKTQLILNKDNQIINENLAYDILFKDLNTFLKKFQNRSDLNFVFILPLPRFYNSPNSCFLNNQSCIIKYSEYIDQIYDLKKVFNTLAESYENLTVFEPGKFFCDENLNYCSMRGNLLKKFIHYRDNENLSQNSEINFFNTLLEKK